MSTKKLTGSVSIVERKHYYKIYTVACTDFHTWDVRICMSSLSTELG